LENSLLNPQLVAVRCYRDAMGSAVLKAVHCFRISRLVNHAMKLPRK
jgi:hypothetical protein